MRYAVTSESSTNIKKTVSVHSHPPIHDGSGGVRGSRGHDPDPDPCQTRPAYPAGLRYPCRALRVSPLSSSSYLRVCQCRASSLFPLCSTTPSPSYVADARANVRPLGIPSREPVVYHRYFTRPVYPSRVRLDRPGVMSDRRATFRVRRDHLRAEPMFPSLRRHHHESVQQID